MIDDNTLHALATKTIIDSLTPEMKQELLARAVKSLFEVPESPPGFYGNKDKRTKIERTFDEALGFASQKIVRDIIAEPEFQEQIRSTIASELQKLFQADSLTKISDLVGKALWDGLTVRDR